MGEKIRLDKCLCMLGLGSRSEVKQLIRGGQVRIDGETVKDPDWKLDAEECLKYKVCDKIIETMDELI